MAANPLRVDPSRTQTIRFQLARQGRVKLKRMADDLQQAVQYSTSWSQQTKTQKLASLQRWTRQLVATHLDRPNQDTYLAEEVRKAHAKGVARSFDEAARAFSKSKDFNLGAKAQFSRDVRNRNRETIDLLVDTANNDIAHMGDQLIRQVARDAGALIRKGATGRQVRAAIRSAFQTIERKHLKAIVNVSIISAHAEGQLDGFEMVGVKRVGIRAEWVTAKDEHVCRQCAQREQRTYTLLQARGLLPFHVGCRCVWRLSRVGFKVRK